MRHFIAMCLFLGIAWTSRLIAGEPAQPDKPDALPSGAVMRLGRSRFVCPGEICAIDFSPDGSTLAVAAEGRGDGALKLFDVQTGLPARQSPFELRGNPRGMVLHFSKDGKELWSGNAVWDVGAWKSAEPGFNGHVEAVSSDLRWVALFSYDKQQLVLSDRDHSDPTAAVSIFDDKNGISSAVFSDDGKTLAVCTYEHKLLLYEVPSGKRLHELAPAAQGLGAVAFSPDGKLLAVVGSAEGVQIFDVGSGQLLRTCRSADRAQNAEAVRFSPDGDSLIADSWRSGPIRVWNPATGEAVGTVDVEGLGGIRNFAFSRDGRLLAIGGSSHGGTSLRVIDWKTKKELFPPTGSRRLIGRLAYSPDSRQLAAGTVASEIHLWDTSSGRLSRTLQADCMGALAYSPDGWLLGAVAREGAYYLWSAGTADELLSRPQWTGARFAHNHACFAFAPELNQVGMGGFDGKVSTLATTSGEERPAFAAYQDEAVAAIASSPNGRLIATASGESNSGALPVANETKVPDRIQLWDAISGKLSKELVSTFIDNPRDRRHRRAGFGEIVFAPDSSTVAALHSSGVVVLWEIAGGNRFSQFEGTDRFCFSADGKMLVRVNGTSVEVIELASGQVCLSYQTSSATTAEPDAQIQGRRQIALQETNVSAMATAPDGLSLATAMTDDNTILLWSLAPDGWTPQPANKPLTDAELSHLWDDLAGADAPAAYSALWQMAAAGDRAVELIRRHVSPAGAAPDLAPRIKQLIADLDNDVFATREKASADLASLGSAAEPLLRQTLAQQPSLEARIRIERLLATFDDRIQRMTGEPLRQIRAIRVLERIGTKHSGELLTAARRQRADARQTRDAKSAARAAAADGEMTVVGAARVIQAAGESEENERETGDATTDRYLSRGNGVDDRMGRLSC